MDNSPPTFEELNTYPHAFFITDTEWHPQSITDEYSGSNLEFNDDDQQYLEDHSNRIDAYLELIPFAPQQRINFWAIPQILFQHSFRKYNSDCATRYSSSPP